MNGAIRVEWTAAAEAQWKRLSYDDATRVAKAVREVEHGLRAIEHFRGDEYRLRLGRFRVRFLLEGDVMHVTAVFGQK